MGCASIVTRRDRGAVPPCYPAKGSHPQAEVSLLERLFGLAFKYRPVIFAQGDLAFSPPWPSMLAVLAALAAATLAVWSYRRRSVPGTSTRARLVLLGLRLATTAVFLLCLLRPVLVLRAIEPQRNFLAVLVDDSRSMTIADDNASPRTAFIRDAFGRSGGLRAALARRFTLRYFRFSAATERAASADGGIVERHPLQHRPGALANRRRAGRAAGVGHRAADRRCGHLPRGLGGHGPLPAVGRSAGLRRRPRSRVARARRPAGPRRSAGVGPQGHDPRRGRRHQPGRLRRPRRAARRGRRGPADRVAGRDAARGRRAGDRARALHAGRGRAARPALPHPRARRRAGDAEQRARRAGDRRRTGARRSSTSTARPAPR